MANRDGWQLWGGFWATSLGTLASRVLGLMRDMATASLLGLGEGSVMDALVIAFRTANLPRRIFGEGALAASFLPVFSRLLERDPQAAWQLISVLTSWLTVLLTVLVLAGEGICVLVAWAGGHDSATLHLAGLTAVLLPYAIFVCLAAQASAALQALLEFRWPAVAPLLLNICWLAAAWIFAPYLASEKIGQAYIIAAAVVISGVLQFAVQWPALMRFGFRFQYDWRGSRDAFWEIARAMLPTTLGLAVTQLNTLLDSFLAWGLSVEAGSTETIPWLNGAVAYPLQDGAAAAIYYGERFYQFPLGILGLAIATVIFPLLSRHAARGERRQIGIDLTLGLRIVWFTALPASVGLVLVAHPLMRLLFERGQFTADDAARAAGMVACYASGIWAYCASPVLVRGFFAVGDRVAPAKIGLVAVLVNVVLNLTLVWLLAERGLAVATSIAATVQVILLAAIFSRSYSRLNWRRLAATLARGAGASTAMAIVVIGVGRIYPVGPASSRTGLLIYVALAIGLGAATYLTVAWLLKMDEWRLLLARPKTRYTSNENHAGD